MFLGGGGGGAVIDIYFNIVIFKASMCFQKIFIVVYFIVTNKFLFKTKNIFLISAQERLDVVSKQKGNISVSAKMI